MSLHATLQLQAALLFFMGAFVLLAHQTSRGTESNRAALWFFCATLCGGTGLVLQSQRGHWPAVVCIVLGNSLFLALVVLQIRSFSMMLRRRRDFLAVFIGIPVVVVGLLAYFTYVRFDTTARVLVVAVAMFPMLLPVTWWLLRTERKAIQPATRVLAFLLLVYLAGCGATIAGILQGMHPESGAHWTGSLLIAGMAVCFVWMEQLETHAILKQQAMTDPLTGLLNRRAMELLGQREFNRAGRSGTAMSLLTVDIDHFKNINDRFGHAAGDRTLVAVATVLNDNVRGHDLTVRTGGDEFVVLLPESSPEGAEETARRILAAIAGLQMSADSGERFDVSVTVGLCTADGEALSFADMLRVSDMDLYQKKLQRPVAMRPGPLVLSPAGEAG